MKNKILLSVCVATFLFAGCGASEKVEQLENTMKAVQNADEVANQVNTNNDLAQKRIEERKQRGDTLAMPYKKLQEYLPTAPAGYTAEAPTGESMNMPGASYSQARIRFTKGNDEITITMTDYNQAYAIYQGAVAVWAMGMEFDNDNETAKGYKLNHELSGGWERYEKISKDATLSLGVCSRFFIEIKASNQTNTDFVKSIANSMKLGELSKM
jgi:hypothetical protein